MEIASINQIICGNVSTIIRGFSDESINLVVTSPPYWGLRDYGEEATTIWDGQEDCEHEWGAIFPSRRDKSGPHGPNSTIGEKEAQHAVTASNQGSFCSLCGAWRGQLGLEPHPRLYIEHLVQVCRELRRVLRKDGSFYLNMGDTYFGSWGNYGNRKELTGEDRGQREGNAEYFSRRAYQDTNLRPPTSSNERSNWLQPKQLLLIPSRTAIALQEDGWILRNDICWHKENHMPSSVRDRLTNSWEHVFHFVKSRRYYYDLDAIRVPHKADSGWAKGKNLNLKRETTPVENYLPTNQMRNGSEQSGLRNPESWMNPNGKNPSDYWSITTQPFKGAHFAVFPEKLIEPMIKASCPEDGVVLDPFAGSGTTCVVAKKLGRNYIGIDVKENYCKMARTRLSKVSEKLLKYVGGI